MSLAVRNAAKSTLSLHRRVRYINVERCIRAMYPFAAIAAIAYLEAQALAAGIDGIILILSCCAISGIAGYELKTGEIIGTKKTKK